MFSLQPLPAAAGDTLGSWTT